MGKMLKTMLVLALVAACGDNIRSWAPDASLDAAPHWNKDGAGLDPTPPDAPPCLDPHTGMGRGHERNCEKHLTR